MKYITSDYDLIELDNEGFATEDYDIDGVTYAPISRLDSVAHGYDLAKLGVNEYSGYRVAKDFVDFSDGFGSVTVENPDQGDIEILTYADTVSLVPVLSLGEFDELIDGLRTNIMDIEDDDARAQASKDIDEAVTIHRDNLARCAYLVSGE